MAPPIKKKENQPYTEKWLALHDQRIKATERPYRARNPLPELESKENPKGMTKNDFNYLMQIGAAATLRHLQNLGVLSMENGFQSAGEERSARPFHREGRQGLHANDGPGAGI